MSNASCDAIFAVLSRHFADVRVAVVNDLLDLELLAVRRPDLVFLGMKFITLDSGSLDDEKVWLSDYLEQRGIACTGSAQKAHEFEYYKPLAKQRVIDSRLRTAAFCVIKQGQSVAADDISLHFPLFVKPTNRGGGCGIDSGSVVHTIEQLQTKAHALATEFHADSLVEEYLPGREFSVAILKDQHTPGFLAMPIELVAPLDDAGIRLLSRSVKLSNSEQALAVTDPALKNKVATLGLDVFHALGARDYGRIDIRLDGSGTPHFLEANLIPSLICGYGSFPKACVLNVGLAFEPMILRITQLGLARACSTSGISGASLGRTLNAHHIPRPISFRQ